MDDLWQPVKNMQKKTLLSEKHKPKRGPTPKSPELHRNHRVAVYLNGSEWKIINGFSELSKVCPAAYLRQAALNSPPVVIPPLNQQVWTELAKALSNLNQIAKAINSNNIPELTAIKQTLTQLRAALVTPR